MLETPNAARERSFAAPSFDAVVSARRDAESENTSVTISLPDLSSAPIPLGRILGSGGTSIVYSAIVEHIPVAIKVLRPECAIDEESIARFSREIFVVDALRHPAVPECYGYGYCSDGRPFAAFAHVEGTTLRERMRGGEPLSLIEGLALMDDLLEVLILAHQKGILHRDIKPSNVILGPRGLPHLLDFGLAQLLDAKGLRATVAGVPLGTPAFMAPEQAMARPSTPATDLFALALTIASGLAGHSLRTGASSLDLLVEARLPLLPLCTFELRLPLEVEALLEKALAFNPAERFESAEAMQRATRVVARELGIALPLRRDGVGAPLPTAVASETTLLSSRESDDYGWLPVPTTYPPIEIDPRAVFKQDFEALTPQPRPVRSQPVGLYVVLAVLAGSFWIAALIRWLQHV
jgi:serine/threonine protein kinase